MQTVAERVVTKRDGTKQVLQPQKIARRFRDLSVGLELGDSRTGTLTADVLLAACPGILTSELDTLAAETAAARTPDHPDYNRLAGRVAVSSLHKRTSARFSEVIQQLHDCLHLHSAAPLISEHIAEFVAKTAKVLDAAIDHTRDFAFDYFGFQTLCKSYLLKDTRGKIVERPQHMFMRVACGIHCPKDVQEEGLLVVLGDILETYEWMSQRFFIHASPTLFHAGTPHPQMSSCFLLDIIDDSIEGIYKTLKRCATISKHGGGVGIALHRVRASGSYIRGSNGTSSGLIPMLRVFDASARYVTQGNKRKGAITVYLEPWHADVFDFLELRKNSGSEQRRARDLFYGMWIPDLFMQRVEADEQWSLFCPDQAPGLADVWGEAFENLYTSYEKREKEFVRRKVSARTLFQAIVQSQEETGGPFMCYKDHCNRKSNQQNLGTIRCSNLCTEIIEYCSPEETAVCNLASVALPSFIREKTFDFDKLEHAVRILTRNLNKVIDKNFDPIAEATVSNRRHRPIGIGVQGLADAFIKLRMPFDSPEAASLNREIFETMYYAACKASMELAKLHGPYDSFVGSPMSKGQFQFDLWNHKPSARYDWETLRQDIMTHGVRNSLLIAPMPTATTAQILGFNEAFEPYTSNLLVRRTMAGEFVCISRNLITDLVDRNLWCQSLRERLIAHNGSVQQLDEVPADLKALYKTAWEIKGKVLVDLAADRGPFVCQSQSLNIWMPEANEQKLTSLHFYAWRRGLKTGMYYLRTQPATQPIPFTVDPSIRDERSKRKKNEQVCTPDSCIACSS